MTPEQLAAIRTGDWSQWDQGLGSPAPAIIAALLAALDAAEKGEAFYRIGLELAVNAIGKIQGWDSAEDERLTAVLLAELQDCLSRGDAWREVSS